MSASSRGWGSPRPYGHPDIVPMRVAGQDFPAGVHYRVKHIMESVAHEYHAHVEPLANGCWGHAYRKIRGSDAWSNHAWGLAIDINAPQHPMGYDTMSARQEQECSRIAAKHGCRWGGNYSGRIDPMHFEFMGTPAEADHIAANNGGGPTEGETMITRGDQGEIVQQWQQALMRYFWYQNIAALPKYGADSQFGDETIEWTTKWAHENGLARGMVTPMHWVVMGLSLHRRDDPAGVVDPGQPVRMDDFSLLDFAWHNRRDIDRLQRTTVNVDEQALAEALAARIDINVDEVKTAVREVLREGVA